VAIGPASDGGYYLIAINAAAAHRAIPALFDDGIPWGTSDVLSDTLDRATAAGLSVAELDPLDDVDRPEDLHVWRRVLADEDRVGCDPTVSVVMPAIDEERHVGEAVESARAAGVHEVIVVDGGSADSTAERAREAGAIVLGTARGRAMQVNAGAAEAVGDVLLFLHADSRLPSGAVADIARAIGDTAVAMGAFQFDAGGGHARDRFMSWAGRMRHRAFGLPYGDQGQFLRRRDFEDLGGMPQIPVMEEWELARRCARLGRIATTPSRVWTSGRAWHEHGAATVVAVNAAVIAGYRLGANPEDLARWRAGIAPSRRPEPR
jgi:rSAM/selenodomain-associated transferase 2